MSSDDPGGTPRRRRDPRTIRAPSRGGAATCPRTIQAAPRGGAATRGRPFDSAAPAGATLDASESRTAHAARDESGTDYVLTLVNCPSKDALRAVRKEVEVLTALGDCRNCDALVAQAILRDGSRLDVALLAPPWVRLLKLPAAAARAEIKAAPRTVRVAAAASPRLDSTDCPRRGRGAAATRFHGLSASPPRRRRDSFPRTLRVAAATRLHRTERQFGMIFAAGRRAEPVHRGAVRARAPGRGGGPRVRARPRDRAPRRRAALRRAPASSKPVGDEGRRRARGRCASPADDPEPPRRRDAPLADYPEPRPGRIRAKPRRPPRRSRSARTARPCWSRGLARAPRRRATRPRVKLV